jgi:hypothetical protein
VFESFRNQSSLKWNLIYKCSISGSRKDKERLWSEVEIEIGHSLYLLIKIHIMLAP